MHAYGKTNNTVHSGYASYSRGTETAKVEGLWLAKDPNTHVKNTQMTVIAPLRLSCALLLQFPPTVA